MKKFVSVAAILVVLMLATEVLPAFAAPPTIKRPMELLVATIPGGGPETVDPAWCYDTASAELIFNVYETLIYFDGELLESYIPMLATSMPVIENITGTTSPEGLAWYYRYTFEIRTGITFHNGYALTPEDVEYSFERAMVQDRIGGPTWMFYEPLLNTWGAEGLGDLSNPEMVIEIGHMIDHAVESNSTHVWFNIAFPGAYAPFLQILSQSWSSILSKQWVNDLIAAGRSDWSGDWGDYSGWIAYHYPEVSPLDDPTPVMMGTGPFEFVTLTMVDNYWRVDRNTDYWRGWPVDWPAPPYPSVPLGTDVKPAGYLDSVKVTWAYDTATAESMFLAGDVDFCAIPRTDIGLIVGEPGVRCTYPLPGLAVGTMFFTFDVDPTTPYGKINDYGVFSADGIPRDFFGNQAWGIHNRLAFTYAFDSATYLAEAFLGEAIAPATNIIPGLLCYDPSVPGYTYNIDEAYKEFAKVPGLVTTGFTITVTYNTVNKARKMACERLQAGINAINAKYGTNFIVNVVNIDWGPYLTALNAHQLSTFFIGWLADYPDPHNFAFPFYHSAGTFAAAQNYANPTMDALIEAGIKALPEERCAIYRQIQLLARAETPSMPLYDAIGRHFERDWVVGWFYNIIAPGVYAANLWKWYYVPHALYDTYPEYAVSNRLPEDTNYDGKIDMKDIGWVSKAYGGTYGPPVHARWNFRCDINNDRKIDMKDIGFVAKDYGKTSAVWTPT